MSECDVVEYVTGPGAVHAAEQYVAIYCFSEAIRFRDCQWKPLDEGLSRGRAILNRCSNDVDFQTAGGGVLHMSMQQAVEIVTLHAVVIYELYMLHTHTRQAFRDDRSDAANTYHSKFQPCELLLRSLSPRRDRTLELLPEFRRRKS